MSNVSYYYFVNQLWSFLKNFVESMYLPMLCSQDLQMAANQGRFKLRDLLSVPMQRVLKYHLLLKVQHEFEVPYAL